MTDMLHYAAILSVIASISSGAPLVKPVLCAVSESVRFSWEIPPGSLGPGTVYFTVNPTGTGVFILISSGLLIPYEFYGNRLVYQGNRAARNVTFTLSNIQTSDAGTYTCGAGAVYNVIQNCGQKLVVLGKPTTPGRPVSTPPVYNQQVTLTCKSTSTTVPSDHGLTLTYTWQRDNDSITVNTIGPSYTFRVSSRDSHTYRCRARESQGLESEWSQVYNMEPQYGPYQISLTPSNSSYTVTEHQALPSITCSALCRPRCNYRWLHNGTAFSSGAVLHGQADRSNTGSYICQPFNKHGRSESVTVTVDVERIVSGAASPVLSPVSDTARFSWEIPQGGLGTVSAFLTVSPGGNNVFALLPDGTFLPTESYTARLVYQGNIAARNVTFTLSNIQTSDAGTYTCRDGRTNNVIQNCGQKLVVLGKPTTPGPPVSTTPVYNQQVTFTCTSNSNTVPADHGLTMTYTWQRNNTDITVTSPGSPYSFIVSSRDSHSYRCRARESQGLESEWSQVYNMEPQYGPYQISLFPSNSSYTVTEHQALPSITCSAPCRPGCNYRWLHNGTVISSGALLQGLADRSKTGSYRCQPYNTHGSSDSFTVSVDVLYPADLTIFTANYHHGSVAVNESDSLTLRCQVDSNPRSVIRLLNGTEELKRGDNSLTATYRLESAECRQRGNYSCSASNNIGAPVSLTVELLVQCSPRLDDSVSQELKFVATLGGDVTVSVSVLAYPLPIFTWSRSISASQDLTGSYSPVSDIAVTSRIHLSNLEQQDFGDYRLTVNNGVGSSVTYTVSIVTEGPPQTPAQFRDLGNATTSSVWLSWLPGFNGGRTQTFRIEYRQFATRTWNDYNSYDDSDKMIDVQVAGLISGEIYIFRLQARNDHGDSNRYVFVETTTAGDPPAQQQIDAACTHTGIIAGATVGGILLTLFIGGTVLMVLYRKGYRLGSVPKDAPKSSSHPEPVEMDNRGYSSLDQISAPAQYSNLEVESEKPQYTQLKIYGNSKVSADAAADTSTYEGVIETPPVTYEFIRSTPYQNTAAHSQGLGLGNN